MASDRTLQEFENGSDSVDELIEGLALYSVVVSLGDNDGGTGGECITNTCNPCSGTC